MKAPTEKKNDTIQIIVTTSCDIFNCSNCTQLLPFRKDTRHMSVDCFREAVRSVKDWPGVVGLFGGNPCAHPRFEELCGILEEEIPQQERRGIWTNNLFAHGETVRRVFFPNGRFNLNAHGNGVAEKNIEKWLPGKLIRGSAGKQSMHSPILLDWKELGLAREEWVAYREACDINLNWSAGIAERDGKPFAYFCEVAAAIDGVRGVNNGLPAMPGWWKAKMPCFTEQVNQCCDAGCGVPFRQLGHEDFDFTYDATAGWLRLLADHGTGNTTISQVTRLEDDGAEEATDYMRIRGGK